MKKLLLITLTAFALSIQVDSIAADYTYNWNNPPSVKAFKPKIYKRSKVSKPKLSRTCKNAISAASAENKKARKVGFEWRDTGKFIKQAKKAGGKKCVKLANMAKNQAILAQKQAISQINAGHMGF